MCLLEHKLTTGIRISQHARILIGFIHTFVRHFIQTLVPKIQFTILQHFTKTFDLQLSFYTFTRIYTLSQGFLSDIFVSYFPKDPKKMFCLDEEGEAVEAYMWRLCMMETWDTAEMPGF